MALVFLRQQKSLFISLEDDFIGFDDQSLMKKLFSSLKDVDSVFFAAKNLKNWDSTLLAVLYKLALETSKKNITVDWSGLPKNVQQLVQLALAVDRKPTSSKPKKWSFVENIGNRALQIYETLKKVLSFLTEIFCSLRRLIRGKAVIRSLDFNFALEDCSYKAVGIVSLVSFMIGLILAFVGAIQLQMFGAQIYIASLVTIGMIRIMGAIMVGVIMAGRTGASYAAALGTMQVNEEIDALKTFGFSVTDFLILPRLLSLLITMPLLTVLADFMGMLGGAFVAVLMLDISAVQYTQYSIEAFGLANFLTGVFHGFVYGIIIALCGCYHGIHCGRKADSVGVATTKAVVSSVVIMIVTTGILTFIFQVLGI